MARIIAYLVLLGGPVAALVLYARVVEPGDWPLLALARSHSAGLDPISLAVGCAAGYFAAAVVRFPWSELPKRVVAFLNRLVPGLQLALCAVVCIAVLVYW